MEEQVKLLSQSLRLSSMVFSTSIRSRDEQQGDDESMDGDEDKEQGDQRMENENADVKQGDHETDVMDKTVQSGNEDELGSHVDMVRSDDEEGPQSDGTVQQDHNETEEEDVEMV